MHTYIYGPAGAETGGVAGPARGHPVPVALWVCLLSIYSMVLYCRMACYIIS